LLAAVVLELLHHAPAGDRRVCLSAVLGRQANSYLAKNSLKQLAAERADRVELVARRVVLEQDSRRAAAAPARRPRWAPSAGSYWLCSEQQWITAANLLRALFSAR